MPYDRGAADKHAAKLLREQAKLRQQGKSSKELAQMTTRGTSSGATMRSDGATAAG